MRPAFATFAALLCLSTSAAALWVRTPVAHGRFIVIGATGETDLPVCRVLDGETVMLPGFGYEVIYQSGKGPAERTWIVTSEPLEAGDRLDLGAPYFACAGSYLATGQLEGGARKERR